MKRILTFFIKRIGCKSEFGFEHRAAKSRSVAKRMSELLHPILLMKKRFFILKENFKI